MRGTAVASLTTHPHHPDEHARLPFHPDCPHCRERLVGTLPADQLIGRRTQALIAAGALAFSSAAPSAALAQEPDQEYEGGATPEQLANDPAANPDLDPGGASTELPVEPAPSIPATPTPDDPDAGPVEQEPASDDQPPVIDAGDGSSTPTVTQ